LADARDALANALDQLKVRQASLDANLVRAEIARAQYGQGLIAFTDWDLIESNLITSQQSSLSGRLNAALSIFAWQEALSKGWEP
jgi:outer membrane protein TolC